MQKIFVLAAFVFIGFGADAQVQRKSSIANDTTVNESKADAGKKTNKRQLLLELNLSKEQKQQLKEILQANKSRRAEIINDETLTESQKQDKLKQMRRATAFNLQGILSIEQKSKLRALRRDMNNNDKSKPAHNEEKDF